MAIATVFYITCDEEGCGVQDERVHVPVKNQSLPNGRVPPDWTEGEKNTHYCPVCSAKRRAAIGD